MGDVSGATRLTGVDIARDAVRRMILRGEVTPGTRLPLTDVARQLGTSVTPVREALRELAATGLVDIDAHKGARVHMANAAEVNEIYELRSMLESRAMAEVALLPEENRVVACTIAARLAKQMDDRLDCAAWVTLNRDFHACLADPLRAPWPVLFGLVEALRNRSALPVAMALRVEPGLISEANSVHSDLVAAIRDGDADSAARVTTQHLGSTLKVLLDFFRESDGRGRTVEL